MRFDPEWLLRTLRGFELPPRIVPARYLVALSGGLDSTVLLHALAATRDRHVAPLCALHVDHGLHPESGRWAASATGFAASLGVPCEVVEVSVGTGEGKGPEAAAREARYAAIETRLEAGDWVLSAHHADDQAETLLLNLLRGSGPDGAAGMPPFRDLGQGFLVRPLLTIAHDELAAYAAAHALTWIDDPGNADLRLDRNYLRHEVLPRLSARWPKAGTKLSRSTELLREAAFLLREIDDRDIDAMTTSPGILPAAGLRNMPLERRAGILRRAVDRAGLPNLPAVSYVEIVTSLLDARADSNPVVRWPGAECRRFRDNLYLLAPAPEPVFDGRKLRPGEPVDLGAGLGTLSLELCDGRGIAPELAEAGLVLRRRQGGEVIRPLGDAHSRKLKKLLQDRGVFPWRRDALPLLYAGEDLVAVADLWIDAGASASPGFSVCWHEAPAYT